MKPAFKPKEIANDEGETAPVLLVLTLAEFLAKDIKPREMILAPIIPTQGLAMIHAKRGIGKTHVSLGIAYAVASGGAFLKWKAEKPRRVLFIDGEMPASTLQERLKGITETSGPNLEAADFLRILTPDFQETGIPDLACPDGQAALEPFLDGVDLLILDNLSTLCRTGRENESEGWTIVQAWLLDLRRRGISVLLIHHGGKNGDQRGASKREDILDTVIQLKHPEDYSPSEGARFEVHITKGRGLFGDDAEPYEARLETVEGRAAWTTKTLEDANLSRVIELTQDGMKVRKIAEATGLSKSKAHRLQNRAKAEGKLL